MPVSKNQAQVSFPGMKTFGGGNEDLPTLLREEEEGHLETKEKSANGDNREESSDSDSESIRDVGTVPEIVLESGSETSEKNLTAGTKS